MSAHTRVWSTLKGEQGSGIISSVIGVAVCLTVLLVFVQLGVLGFEFFRLQSLTNEAVREATAGITTASARESTGNYVVSSSWNSSLGTVSTSWTTTAQLLTMRSTEYLAGNANSLVHLFGLGSISATSTGYIE